MHGGWGKTGSRCPSKKKLSYGSCFVQTGIAVEKEDILGGDGQSSGAVCESRGGRPGLSVLTRLLASVDVKQY